MAELLKQYRDIIISYHEHDSLLENIEEEELTEEERKAAWKDYEDEKNRPLIAVQNKISPNCKLAVATITTECGVRKGDRGRGTSFV